MATWLICRAGSALCAEHARRVVKATYLLVHGDYLIVYVLASDGTTCTPRLENGLFYGR
jgi:hypothetical protein